MAQDFTSFIVVPYTSHEILGGRTDHTFMLGYLVRVAPESDTLRRLHFSDGTSVLTTDTMQELQDAIDTARTKAIKDYVDLEVSGANFNLVFMEIIAERERQDAQWGGPEHDDEHTWRDWKMFMIRQLGKLTMDHDLTVEYVHGIFRRVAAIAVAGMQSLARKEKIN